MRNASFDGNKVILPNTRRLAGILAALTALVVLIVGLATGVTTRAVRFQAAQQLVPQVRRYLIMGDVREAELASTPMIGSIFSSIQFIDSSKQIIFSLPGADSQTSSDIIEGAIIEPIRFKDTEAPFGVLVFKYDRFANMGVALGLCLLWGIVAVILFRFLSRKMMLDLSESLELEHIRTVAQMSQNLAHDLKNPLIAFDFAAQSRNWQEFQQSKDQMNRSLTTIRTILGRMGKGQGSITTPQDTRFDIATISADLKRLFADHKVGITYHGPVDVQVYLDSVAVERAITNLARNSIEAGAKDIVIEASIEGGQLTIAVSDDGPGLPAQVLSKLFQRGATHGKTGGSGIGLHNVKAIVEAHGGKVQHARETGRTKFTMLFPNAAMTNDAPAISDSKRLPLLHKRSSRGPSTVLVGLQNRARQQDLVTRLSELAIPVVTDDPIGSMPVLVYSDLDEFTDKYLAQSVRVVFHESTTTLEKSTKLILSIYRSLQSEERTDES